MALIPDAATIWSAPVPLTADEVRPTSAGRDTATATDGPKGGMS